MNQSPCSSYRSLVSQSRHLSHQHLHLVCLFIIVVFARCCHSTEEPRYQDGGGVTATTLATDIFADCNLLVDIPDNVRENLMSEDQSVHFVYANLKFLNQDLDPRTGYLSNGTRYITPLRWVLASGRRGDVFLGFPAIFKGLSLGMLGLEVISVQVTVNLDECNGFMDATDEVKQEQVANVLYKTINTTSGLADYKVCQEIAHLPSALLGDATWLALLFNIYHVVYNTRHECWYEADSSGLSKTMVLPPAWLLPPTITLGILGAIILPLMIIRFIQRNNSPLVREVCKRDANGVRVGTGKVRRYYNRSTSLPVGLKYLVYYYSTSVIEVIRAIAGCALFYAILCPEIFFPIDETYRLRYHTYRSNGYLNPSYVLYHVLRTIMVLLPLLWFVPSIPMLCRIAYKWRRFKLADIPTGVRPYHAESALERSYFGLFPIPDISSYIQPHPETLSGLGCLFYYTVARIQTALNVGFLVSCYVQSLTRVWDCIMKMMWCKSRQFLWEKMAAASCIMTLCVLLPLLVPFYLTLLVFSVFIYLLPSAYVLMCYTSTHRFIISFANWVYQAGFWNGYDDEADQVAMETSVEGDAEVGFLENDDEKEKREEKFMVVEANNESKDDTDHTESVSMATEAKGDTETVSLETEEKVDTEKVSAATEAIGDSNDPKQTIVKFRKGSNSSGNAYIEHVYTFERRAIRQYHKFWPLHQFYHKVYKSIVGEDESDEGQGRKLCLEILFVMFSLLYTIFLLVTISVIVFLLQILILGVVSLLSSLFIIYFFRIIALCTLFGTMMLLSFTGLVINTLRVMPYCILALSLLGFVISVVTQLYSAYAKMLKMVIERCKTLRQDLCFVLVERDEEGAAMDEEDGDEMGAEDEEDGNTEEAGVIPKKKTVTILVAMDKLTSEDSAVSDDADFMIEEGLFWYVAEKCMPLRVLVMAGVMQVVAVILAVVVGVVVLVDIGELQDFTHFGVTLCILVISLVITHTRSLIAVTEEEKKDDLEKAVRKAVVGFDAGSKKEKKD